MSQIQHWDQRTNYLAQYEDHVVHRLIKKFHEKFVSCINRVWSGSTTKETLNLHKKTGFLLKAPFSASWWPAICDGGDWVHMPFSMVVLSDQQIRSLLFFSILLPLGFEV